MSRLWFLAAAASAGRPAKEPAIPSNVARPAIEAAPAATGRAPRFIDGTDEILRALLMYFVLPVWLAAGFADYLCHRAAHIERTSGWKESARMQDMLLV